MALVVEWKGKNFKLKEGDITRLEGYTDKQRAYKFTPQIYENLKETLKLIEGDPLKEKTYIHSQIRQICEEDFPNFLFMRSISELVSKLEVQICKQLLTPSGDFETSS